MPETGAMKFDQLLTQCDILPELVRHSAKHGATVSKHVEPRGAPGQTYDRRRTLIKAIYNDKNAQNDNFINTTHSLRRRRNVVKCDGDTFNTQRPRSGLGGDHHPAE